MKSKIAALLLCLSSTGFASITGLTFSAGNGCFDTINNGVCAPVGVTTLTSLDLLNDLVTSAVNLPGGSYYLYTEFYWQNGDFLNLTINYSDRPTEVIPFTMGTDVINFGPSQISLRNPVLAPRNLVTMGEAPSGLLPGGANDRVLLLDAQSLNPVPEPASLGFVMAGIAVLAIRRRSARLRTTPSEPGK